MSRAIVIAGGLAGASGVALSAVAAHSGGNLGTAAAMLLAHAPALLAIGLHVGGSDSRIFTAGAATVVLGLLLFCGDLVLRDSLGTRLFPMAAPAGGLLLIAGWLLVVAAAAFRR